MIASRWLGMGIVSQSNASSCASCAWNLLFSSPIASASPDSSIWVRDESTRYNPNLSEEEPLFSASTCSSGRPPVMP
jgi:hypothetical protein